MYTLRMKNVRQVFDGEFLERAWIGVYRHGFIEFEDWALTTLNGHMAIRSI